jgi:hypothetical protein
VSIIQLGRPDFAFEPGPDARDARILMTKLAVIELASDALIEALEATIDIADQALPRAAKRRSLGNSSMS